MPIPFISENTRFDKQSFPKNKISTTNATIEITLMMFLLSVQVDAYPAAVTFSWFFNNSEHQQELDEERFTTNNLVSTLNFAPTTNQDYGTLFCLGENAVGHQDEPCAFKIVPTGK